jgi:undecaprenyl-diphosphatase
MIAKLLSRQLPAPIVHLLLAAFCLGCFGIVAIQVDRHWPITTFDFHQAQRMYDFAKAHPLVYDFSLWITDLGSGRPRTIVIAVVTVLLLFDRQWRLAVIWALTQWLVKDIVSFAKNAFERPRPEYPEAHLLAGGWAFPSGHATGAMATYGMLAFIAALNWRGSRLRWPIVALLGLIILAVGLSRMFLGVHWFTDVLGGYLLGLAYISLCVALMEWMRASSRGA